MTHIIVNGCPGERDYGYTQSQTNRLKTKTAMNLMTVFV